MIAYGMYMTSKKLKTRCKQNAISLPVKNKRFSNSSPQDISFFLENSFWSTTTLYSFRDFVFIAVSLPYVVCSLTTFVGAFKILAFLKLIFARQNCPKTEICLLGNTFITSLLYQLRICLYIQILNRFHKLHFTNISQKIQELVLN